MIKAINRMRSTCIWLTVFFLVIFSGWFLVSEVALAGSWGEFVKRIQIEVQDDGC